MYNKRKIVSIIFISLLFITLFSNFALAAPSIFEKAVNSFENGIRNYNEGQALFHVFAFGLAIASLFQGDMAGFTANLMLALPAIGIFFLLYIVARFVSVITIFRGGQHEWYANMFGWGMALIGVSTQAVFQFLYNVFGGVLGMVLFIGLAIWIIWSFIHKMGTGLNKSGKEFNDSKWEKPKSDKDYQNMNKKIDSDEDAIIKDDETDEKEEKEIYETDKKDVDILTDAERKIIELENATNESAEKFRNAWATISNQIKEDFKNHMQNMQTKIGAAKVLRNDLNEKMTKIQDLINAENAKGDKRSKHTQEVEAILTNIKSEILTEFKTDDEYLKFDFKEYQNFPQKIIEYLNKLNDTTISRDDIFKYLKEMKDYIQKLIEYAKKHEKIIIARNNADKKITEGIKKIKKLDKNFSNN